MSRQIILEQISNCDWETKDTEDKFMASLSKSNHLEYLTIHPKQELSLMRLCKVRGQDIGFAITPEREIVSLHNNTGISNLGNALVQKAVELGGEMVFHYDGWLTGFYSNLNFIEEFGKRLIWDDAYAPKNWKYRPIDIYNPKLSVYAREILEGGCALKAIESARERYFQGKPDVITRFIKK